MNVCSVSITRFSTVVGILGSALALELPFYLHCFVVPISERCQNEIYTLFFHSSVVLAHSSGHHNYHYFQSLSSSLPLVSRVEAHSTVIDK